MLSTELRRSAGKQVHRLFFLHYQEWDRPGQYHPPERMGSGKLQRLRIIPSAHADGTDSIGDCLYFFKSSSIAPPSFFIGMSLATIFPSRSSR